MFALTAFIGNKLASGRGVPNAARQGARYGARGAGIAALVLPFLFRNTAVGRGYTLLQLLRGFRR